jgi:nucleoside triphosphate diphosphatase
MGCDRRHVVFTAGDDGFMSAADSSLAGVQQLLDVMSKLRDPVSGCPWDLAQDSRSLARYTLEEACELVAALESGDRQQQRDELGDLLFQVVFHAQLAREQQQFSFDDVARGMATKLVRRHPHVFAPGRAQDAGDWEAIKADERAARGNTGLLADVPHTLPALARSTKLGKRAATVGFDWPDATGARAKVLEELAEVDAAARGEGSSSVEDEIGDLLMAVTSLARQLSVDAETALRRANTRFEQRFALMEQLARVRGNTLPAMTAEALDLLWCEAKKGVQS